MAIHKTKSLHLGFKVSLIELDNHEQKSLLFNNYWVHNSTSTLTQPHLRSSPLMLKSTLAHVHFPQDSTPSELYLRFESIISLSCSPLDIHVIFHRSLRILSHCESIDLGCAMPYWCVFFQVLQESNAHIKTKDNLNLNSLPTYQNLWCSLSCGFCGPLDVPCHSSSISRDLKLSGIYWPYTLMCIFSSSATLKYAHQN